MVLYDLLMIVKSTVPKPQLAEILKKCSTTVLDSGGVLTDITSFGTRALAYEFKIPGEKHFEANMVQMTFNAKPSVVAAHDFILSTDERVMRWIHVKGKALKNIKSFKAVDPRNIKHAPKKAE